MPGEQIHVRVPQHVEIDAAKGAVDWEPAAADAMALARDGELAADVSYLDRAIESLAPLLRRPALVVGKSTVPVGTAERLAERIVELAPVGEEAVLSWSPEFLREGYAVEDTLTPSRLVFGLPDSPQAEGALETLRSLQTLQQELRRTTDASTRQVILAPADGDVINLRFTSPGAVDPSSSSRKRALVPPISPTTDGISVPEMSPRAFSFNSPHGACQSCQGLGATWQEHGAEA